MSDFPTWRKILVQRLQDRNKIETHTFKDLILLQNKLFDTESILRNENLQLSVEHERLRSVNLVKNEFSSEDNGISRKLEQKLLSQQEELTKFHRKKSENIQKLIDLNEKLLEKDKLLTIKEFAIDQQSVIIASLKLDLELSKNSMLQLDKLNSLLKDENTTLHLSLSTIEDKLIQTQKENKELIDRLINHKSRDVEKMNEDNDKYLKKRNDKMLQELEDAASEGISRTNGVEANTKNL